MAIGFIVLGILLAIIGIRGLWLVVYRRRR